MPREVQHAAVPQKTHRWAVVPLLCCSSNAVKVSWIPGLSAFGVWAPVPWCVVLVGASGALSCRLDLLAGPVVWPCRCELRPPGTVSSWYLLLRTQYIRVVRYDSAIGRGVLGTYFGPYLFCSLSQPHLLTPSRMFQWTGLFKEGFRDLGMCWKMVGATPTIDLFQASCPCCDAQACDLLSCCGNTYAGISPCTCVSGYSLDGLRTAKFTFPSMSLL